MFRYTITLDERTASDVAVAEFRRIASAKLGESVGDIALQVEKVVSDLAASGHQLAAIGSQFKAGRSLTGPGYEIRIVARFGSKPSLLERLRAVILRN